jgi:hypothetical protein
LQAAALLARARLAAADGDAEAARVAAAAFEAAGTLFAQEGEAAVRPPDLRAFLAADAETRPAVGSQTRTVAALKVFFRLREADCKRRRSRTSSGALPNAPVSRSTLRRTRSGTPQPHG